MCIYLLDFISVYLFDLISCQGIIHMDSSGAVGDILVFTFVNISDNIVYTENRKYFSSVVVVVVREKNNFLIL